MRTIAHRLAHCLLMTMALAPLGAHAASETIVYSFKGGADGTTSAGGMYNYGTVFRVSLSGAEKVLHAFGSTGDGRGPNPGLVHLGGALYGTTSAGGANGQGTVFKILR